MLAYNPGELENLVAQEQVNEVYEQGLISKEELEGINAKYPIRFYSPNIFIRVGLFVLTIIIAVCSFGIIALLFMNAIEDAIGGLAIFFGFTCILLLEHVVGTKKHLRSGLDDALCWISAGCLFGGGSLLLSAGALTNCALVFILSLFYTLRYADRLMSLVVPCSSGALIYLVLTRSGGQNFMLLVPFVLMSYSIIAYLLVVQLKGKQSNPLYAPCLETVSIAALVSIYLCGNYYVVSELQMVLFADPATGHNDFPFGWLFWVFTVFTPCLYILQGIRVRDIVLIRVGLVLIAASVITVRNFYPQPSIEASMTLGGIGFIVTAYLLGSYLKVSRRGFLNIAPNGKKVDPKTGLEAIVLAESFAGNTTPGDGTKFGGGSFGGGGSSGGF